MGISAIIPLQIRECIDEQHEKIHIVMDQLSRGVHALEPTAPDPAAFRRILEQLGELQSQLSAHFLSEDATDFHGRLVRALPEASSEVRRLLQEHDTFLESLEELRKRVRRCTPLQVQSLREDLERICEALFLHESAEDDLAMRAADPTQITPPAAAPETTVVSDVTQPPDPAAASAGAPAEPRA